MAELAERLKTNPTPEADAPTPAPSPSLTPAAATCDVDGCTEPATASYVWAWGATGVCCARHQFILQQRARNLKRTIQFMPLVAGAPPAISRDERVQFHAQILAAEDELRDAKGRTSALYEQNQQLVGEIKRLQAVNAELNTGLDKTRAKLDQTLSERDGALVDLHEARDQVVRLQTLCDALEGAKSDGD
jgi:hypothetical protein